MRETALPKQPLTALVDAARAIAPVVSSYRDETERSGRTPPPVVRALVDAGLFRMWLPAALDGWEADPATFFQVIEEVSAADGAVGWNLMNGACCGLMSVYLTRDAGRMIYGAPDAVIAGQIAPNGEAIAVDGGYRVSGRWSFGSGIQHATWIVGGCVIFDGDVPRSLPSGGRAIIQVMTPPARVSVDESSWQVSGLRGTGSCDYTLDDVFIPSEHSFTFFVSETFYPGPLALLPRTMFALSVSAVTLGIARGALERFAALAATAKAPGLSVPLCQRPDVQLAVARAEALIGAAHAYVRETSGSVWQTCREGERPSVKQRLRLRAASVVAPQMCADAVDVIWKAAGALAIREAHTLERDFRDIHAATQHLGVSEALLYDTGRGLLGLEPQIVPF
jgi:alkylation response protein AidB-like acyl-CoA dehydrogenase